MPVRRIIWPRDRDELQRKLQSPNPLSEEQVIVEVKQHVRTVLIKRLTVLTQMRAKLAADREAEQGVQRLAVDLVAGHASRGGPNDRRPPPRGGCRLQVRGEDLDHIRFPRAAAAIDLYPQGGRRRRHTAAYLTVVLHHRIVYQPLLRIQRTASLLRYGLDVIISGLLVPQVSPVTAGGKAMVAISPNVRRLVVVNVDIAPARGLRILLRGL